MAFSGGGGGGFGGGFGRGIGHGIGGFFGRGIGRGRGWCNSYVVVGFDKFPSVLLFAFYTFTSVADPGGGDWATAPHSSQTYPLTS